jgi:cytosine/creatinine deaminase
MAPHIDPATDPVPLVTNARIHGRPGRSDIHISDGLISAISVSDRPAAGAIDAEGALALPGFVEAHIHLEKAYLLDRLPRDAANLQDAIALTAAAKRSFTPADMRDRSQRVIDLAIEHGVTAMRCHVELDDVLGLSAIETILDLRSQVRGQLDLQIVAFPQEGIHTQSDGPGLMRAALGLGVDAVGGIPYNDVDADEHLDLVFELAEEFGLPIDLHLDLSDDPDQRDVEKVIARTLAHGMQGRVTVGHLTSLGSVPLAEARAIASRLADAQISVVCLPTTDVFLNGRHDMTRPRRGLTPVRLLQEEGVNVAAATNNIQNPFTPFGRGNILDVAVLLAELCHFGTADDARSVIEMITSRAAQAIGLPHFGLEAGNAATINLFTAATHRDVLNNCVKPSAQIRAGGSYHREESSREQI